jgi:hypothetical protein
MLAGRPAWHGRQLCRPPQGTPGHSSRRRRQRVAPLHAGAHLQAADVLEPSVRQLGGQPPQHRGPRRRRRPLQVPRLDSQPRRKLGPLHLALPPLRHSLGHRLGRAAQRRLGAHRRAVGRHVAAHAGRQAGQVDVGGQRHAPRAAAQHLLALAGAQRAQRQLCTHVGGGRACALAYRGRGAGSRQAPLVWGGQRRAGAGAARPAPARWARRAQRAGHGLARSASLPPPPPHTHTPTHPPTSVSSLPARRSAASTPALLLVAASSATRQRLLRSASTAASRRAVACRSACVATGPRAGARASTSSCEQGSARLSG